MTKQRLFWWSCFIGSTFALSKVFEASRALTSGQMANPMELILWGALLVLSFVLLGYDGYCKAKSNGTLSQKLWFYEKFQQLQQRENTR